MQAIVVLMPSAIHKQKLIGPKRGTHCETIMLLIQKVGDPQLSTRRHKLGSYRTPSSPNKKRKN
jgi:hypothetical protein